MLWCAALSGCLLTAHWSPDGKKVLYVQKDKNQFYQIWSYEPGKFTVKQVTPRGSVHAFAPQWSPDGTKIAFKTAARLGGEFKIWVLSPASEKKQAVADGFIRDDFNCNNVLPPRWSPDSRELYYVTQTDSVYQLNRVSLADRKTKTVFKSREEIQFIAGHDTLAVLADGLYLVSGDGSYQEKILEIDNPKEYWLFSWTRDKKNLLLRVSGISENISQVNVADKTASVIFESSGELIYLPQYSPAANTIWAFFTSAVDDHYDLLEISMDGLIKSRILSIPALYDNLAGLPAWSPDRRQFLYYTRLNPNEQTLYPWMVEVPSGRRRFIGDKTTLSEVDMLNTMLNELLTGGKKHFLGTIGNNPGKPDFTATAAGFNIRAADNCLSPLLAGRGMPIHIVPAPERKHIGQQTVIYGEMKKVEVPRTSGAIQPEGKGSSTLVKYIAADRVFNRMFYQIRENRVSQHLTEFILDFRNPLERPLTDITFYLLPVNFIGEKPEQNRFHFSSIQPGETRHLAFPCQSRQLPPIGSVIIWAVTEKKDIIFIADYGNTP